MMNKEIDIFKNKIIYNLISFFIEFLLFSNIFKSGIKNGKIFNFLLNNFSFLTKEFILSGSLGLILLSVSLRVVYTNYLNKRIDKLEKTREIIVNKKVVNSQVKHQVNYCNYSYVNNKNKEKKLVKLYKK